MSRTIPQRDLRNRNAEVVEAVARGEDFIVTRNGTPVAELRPVTAGKRRFVSKTDLIAVAATGPHLDAARFRADLEKVTGERLTR
ncbi:MAG: type II toxin-antitoxin system prevent-host-death family antitoxin [Chloroflexi bacterium]|nr:MAG: type II toxin-antitoxin system prevent-host-death family antitoxin [Chloroflexota bacterium]